MRPDILSALVCPSCRLSLAEVSGALVCENGHTFDIARQGYVNLLPGGAHTGTADSQSMVAARAAFLARGHYAPVSDALAQAAADAVALGAPGVVLDAGGGTGHYLAAVLDRLPGRAGVVLDISKHAARRAARAHERAGAVVCDAWGALPVGDGAAALVLSVFAPRNAPEFARVLRPGGALLTVTPTARHLAELVEAFGLVTVDARKEERLADALDVAFERAAAQNVERPLLLARDDVVTVVGMGPSARHVTGPEIDERVASLAEPVSATLSVTVATWRAR